MGRLPRDHSTQKTRTPMGVHRMKLTVDNIPEGKSLRWVNDDPGRVDMALDGGYTFVENAENIKVGTTGNENQAIDSRVSRVVKIDERGNPVRAYLMAIDKEFYDQDQKDKQKALDDVDDAILNGAHQNEKLGKHGYVPKNGISIRRG